MTKKSKSEMIVITGRNTGKSVWSQMVQSMIPPDIKLVDSAEVDGSTWHTVKLTIPAATWLRTQPSSEWREHIDARYYIGGSLFDVSETLYSVLALKWK